MTSLLPPPLLKITFCPPRVMEKSVKSLLILYCFVYIGKCFINCELDKLSWVYCSMHWDGLKSYFCSVSECIFVWTPRWYREVWTERWPLLKQKALIWELDIILAFKSKCNFNLFYLVFTSSLNYVFYYVEFAIYKLGYSYGNTI